MTRSAFNRSDTVVQGIDFSPSGITGAGNLVQMGPGTLVLNTANSYAGTTTVSGGAPAFERRGAEWWGGQRRGGGHVRR